VRVPGDGPIGRGAELPRVDAFLAAAREDVHALVLVGPAGIGKTSVWQEGVRRAAADGALVLSARPTGGEVKLSFAALADLLAPVDEETLDVLPAPQRRALDVALLRGDEGGEPLDSRAVATGLLSLLRELALRAPVVLAVDDAQWLDAASAAALEFAVRRLIGLPVGVLVAVRAGDTRPETFEQSLPREQRDELEIVGLGVAALHGVLKEHLGRAFPRPVLVRIAAASGGNPFYALEIGRELDRVGVPPAGAPLPVPKEVQSLARARLQRLPESTFEPLLLAASVSRPHVSLLDVDALTPAEQAGLVEVAGDGGIRFSHPLVASAVYESAPSGLRQRTHRTLAARVTDPEESARHLALAATGPDEETAAALERAGDLVAGRGAVAAAAELGALALRLTPAGEEDALVRRQQALAERLYFAGDASGARRELEALVVRLAPGEQRAEVLLELGSVVWSQGEGDAGLELFAQALAETDEAPLRARIHSRISAMSDDCDLGVEHGEAALALLDEQADPILYSFALHNVARWKLYAGRGADHEAIERGIRLQRAAAAWEVSAVPAYWARDFDDFDTARARFDELLRAFEEQGDEARRCAVLAHLAVIEAMTGRLGRARELAAESRDLAEQTEQDTWINISVWAQSYVSAQAGDAETAQAGAREVLARLEASPDVTIERMARDVLGVAAFAAGDFEEADGQLSRADAIDAAIHVREPAAERFHGDHAEAVIALDDLGRADLLVARLEKRATSIPRPWLCAVSARCRALLLAARGDLGGALGSARDALAAHEGLDMPVERARTVLVLGQLLRRSKQRREARAAFQEALDVFESVGSELWAKRARAELARVPVRRAPGDLTPTEERIAGLAAAGLTNRVIAEQIFVSPKTVESNLARVYRKLSIRSRAELGRAMAERERLLET
jgi:DNA-binding CsgD family transcriptional regulator